MNRRNRSFLRLIETLSIAFLAASSAFAQVTPGEIANPKLKAAEEAYLPQIRSLQHAINDTQFALPFVLTRYVGVDP